MKAIELLFINDFYLKCIQTVLLTLIYCLNGQSFADIPFFSIFLAKQLNNALRLKLVT